MKIINRARGNGKTAMLISTAYCTDMPIVVKNENHKSNLLNLAQKMNCKIRVYTLREFEYLHLKEEILIDDVDIMLEEILERYFSTKVCACTMRLNMEERNEKF